MMPAASSVSLQNSLAVMYQIDSIVVYACFCFMTFGFDIRF
jgi:hypothetical protein